MKIWNILHDGEITAIERIESNKVKLFINIPYLRRRIKPIGDSFILVLSGVTMLMHVDFEDKEESIEEVLYNGGPEILVCESETMPYSINTTMGKLRISYNDLEIELEDGQNISESEMEKVCIEYWEEWKNKWGIK